MNEKPIPDFMKEYMERIGPDCFLDFQRLSREYYNTKQAFHEKKFPLRVPVNNRMTPKVDLETEMRRIDADFKGHSLELGCKHSYEQPAPEYYDMDLSGIQEGGLYQDKISYDDFDLLPEDKTAKQAHRAFDAKHPEKTAEREVNRETIEHFFGDGRNAPKKPDPAKNLEETKGKQIEIESPEKEVLTREDRVMRFSLTRDDITKIDDPSNGIAHDRYIDVPPPDGTDPPKDRDDIEMELDM